MSTADLAEHFINNAPRFHEDLELDDIDEKHVKILTDSYKEVKAGSAFNKNSFRNWKGQSDTNVPAQINASAIQGDGLALALMKYAYLKLLRRSQDKALLTTFMDDMAIINMIGGGNLLEENPVHQTPGSTLAYHINNTSVNLRWLRYIYLLKRILDLDILTEGGIWVDVGSFYGGLQGLVHKYNPEAKIVMVDFHHQLCRSYIYLSQLYPDAKHILPKDLSEYNKLEELPKGAFMYVPVSEYDAIADQTVDLVSNFFSLGEMRREFFNIYHRSRLFRESKKVYLVNRFVSAPFFEKTYDTDVSILDYTTEARSIDSFDVFPMHHFMQLKRQLFGRKSLRNTSSSYFEMMTSLE